VIGGAGKLHAQFERRTEASARAIARRFRGQDRATL